MNKKKKTDIKEPSLADSYLIDLSVENMLYAALIRSTVAGKVIDSIDTSVLGLGYYFFTSKDIPGGKAVKILNSSITILADKVVHYVGEPIGIVAGPDLRQVRYYAKNIKVTYKEDKESEGASKEVEDEEEERISARKVVKTGIFCKEERKEEKEEDKEEGEEKEGEEEEGKSKEDKVTSYFNSSSYVVRDMWNYKEAEGELSYIAGAITYLKGEALYILSCEERSKTLIGSVSSATKIKEDHIKTKRTARQGTDKTPSWLYYLLITYSSIVTVLTKKAVKLLYSHEELEAYYSNINTNILMASAVNQEGRITAFKALISLDLGYYAPYAEEVCNKAAISILNTYAVPNLSIEVVVQRSNTSPRALLYENIDGAAFFAIESHLNHIAQVTKLLPSALRLANIDNASNVIKFKNINYKGTMEALLKETDFNRKYVSYCTSSDRNFLEDDTKRRTFWGIRKRGIALSCAYEPSYFYGSSVLNKEIKVTVTLTIEGKVLVMAPRPSAAVLRIWKKLVSTTLQIEESAIELEEGEESEKDNNYGVKSYNISLMTTLLKRACLDIQKKRFKLPLPLVAKRSLTGSARRVWNNDKLQGTPYYSASYVTVIAEVEINPFTYKVRIPSIYVAIDCGEVFDKEEAKKTVLRQVYKEAAAVTEDRSCPIEKVRVLFIPSNNAPSQIGKILHNGLRAAVNSALSCCLSSYVRASPVSSDVIYNVINTKNEFNRATKDKGAVKEAKNENNSYDK